MSVITYQLQCTSLLSPLGFSCIRDRCIDDCVTDSKVAFDESNCRACRADMREVRDGKHSSLEMTASNRIGGCPCLSSPNKIDVLLRTARPRVPREA